MIEIQESKDLFGDPVASVPTIDREQLADVLHSIVKDFTLGELVHCLTNEYAEAVAYIDLMQGKKACQKTSLLFNPHRLDTGHKSKPSSIYKSLRDKKWCSGLARATLFKKGLVNELLYQVLQLNIDGTQYVNEFPPHVARDMAHKYRLGLGSKVLDPCAGWGGRMIGLSTVVNSYTAFEPSTRTHAGLIKLSEFLQKFRPDFMVDVKMECFEDSSLEPSAYDFAITSPPYYDTEHYSDEATNSCNRYHTFDEWRDGFFAPLVQKTMYALKPECVFVLNIGSRVYPLGDTLRGMFGDKYTIGKITGALSGVGGLGKAGEGETFYTICGK